MQKKDKWNLIIKDLSNKYWLKKIDNHARCGQCEFRCACDSRIFMDVDKNCQYNV